MRERGRLGVWRFRFNAGGGKKITVNSVIGSPEFLIEYTALMQTRKEILINSKPLRDMKKHLNRCMIKAKTRSTAAGREFDLDLDFLMGLYVENFKRCALSGVTFRMEASQNSKRRPFAPSIDKIVPTGGYTRGNVRLVCLMANYARSDFNDAEFYEMCQSARKKKTAPHEIRGNKNYPTQIGL